MTSLVDQYYAIYDKYSLKFEKTAVLLQCGGFYELYQPKDESKGNAKEISRIIHCIWKPKDYRFPEATHLVGIPTVSYDKYINILLQNGYTCVIVTQIIDKNETIPGEMIIGSGETLRGVTEILSPNTDFNSTKLMNNVVSIYVKKIGTREYSVGVSVADILVSNVITIAEWVTETFDPLTEFLLFYKPVETFLISNEPVSQLKEHRFIHYDMYSDCPDTNGYSDPINFSLKGLKKYLKDRLVSIDELVIEYYSNDYLELTSTAIHQLDIDLLLPILDFTQTAMGFRLLNSRLKKPFFNKESIQDSYDNIEFMSDNPEDPNQLSASAIKSFLKNIPDLDKLIRKLSSTGKFTFTNFYTLRDSLQLLKKEIVQNGMLDEVLVHCEIIVTPFAFKSGYNTILDTLYKDRKTCNSSIDEILGEASKQFSKPITFKLKDTLGFITTKPRADELKRIFPDWNFNLNGKEMIVSNEVLVTLLNKKQFISESITTLEKLLFQEFIVALQNYIPVLKVLSEKVALLDFYQSAFFCKEKYRLCQPVITSDHQVLEIKNLRHLVIEKFNECVKYVPNNLSLKDDGTIGYIIYGVNSSGKSSFLKATGLSVIMAQAGLYVPAESMIFSPLKRIFTRICGKDDIEKGKSSFIVELSEILSILEKADSQSLSLCDELSKGSESDSAAAINHTLFTYLSSIKSFFLTTTHLHDISEDLEKIDSIKIFHMKVFFENEIAIFERKLIQGPGPELYGLEIARNMNFPKSFIEAAFSYRNKSVKVRKSRYNAKKIVSKCELCDYTVKTDYDLPIDTHHIIGQCEADSDGYIGVYHKNSLHNIINVCKICHQKIHNKTLFFDVKETLKGRIITSGRTSEFF